MRSKVMPALLGFSGSPNTCVSDLFVVCCESDLFFIGSSLLWLQLSFMKVHSKRRSLKQGETQVLTEYVPVNPVSPSRQVYQKCGSVFCMFITVPEDLLVLRLSKGRRQKGDYQLKGKTYLFHEDSPPHPTPPPAKERYTTFYIIDAALNLSLEFPMLNHVPNFLRNFTF